MEYLALFTAFVFKHFLADFPLQNQRMVDEKGKYGAWGGIEHSGIHGWLTMLIISVFLRITFGYNVIHCTLIGILVGMLDGVVHYHVDWAKMNLARGLTVADRNYWLYLGFDQLLHYLTYVLIVGIVL